MRWYTRLVDEVGGIFFHTLVALSILVLIPVGAELDGWYYKFGASKVVVHRSIPYPSGRPSAVVYEVEGNATVGFNTQVSIAPADGPFSRDRTPSFFSVHGQHDLAVRWISEKMIEIEIPKGETIYGSDPRVGDITVEYR